MCNRLNQKNEGCWSMNFVLLVLGYFFCWGLCVCLYFSSLEVFVEERCFSSEQCWSLPPATLGACKKCSVPLCNLVVQVEHTSLLRISSGWQHFHNLPRDLPCQQHLLFKKGFYNVPLQCFCNFHPLATGFINFGYWEQTITSCNTFSWLEDLLCPARLFFLRLKRPAHVKLTTIFHLKELLFSAVPVFRRIPFVLF